MAGAIEGSGISLIPSPDCTSMHKALEGRARGIWMASLGLDWAGWFWYPPRRDTWKPLLMQEPGTPANGDYTQGLPDAHLLAGPQ